MIGHGGESKIFPPYLTSMTDIQLRRQLTILYGGGCSEVSAIDALRAKIKKQRMEIKEKDNIISKALQTISLIEVEADQAISRLETMIDNEITKYNDA